MARLYGVTHVSSHGTVTNGFAAAMRRAGKLEGLVEVNMPREIDDDPVGGGAAHSAVFTASLDMCFRMRQNASHQKRYVMFAVNSNRVPNRVLEGVEYFATDLLAPSTWNQRVLSELSKLPVHLAPHGVDAALRPAQDQPCRRDPVFRVMHYSTSARARKGTRPLVQAFRNVMRGRKAELTLVLDAHQSLLWRDLHRPNEGVTVTSRRNHTTDTFINDMAHTHLVAQPSRGEGFGLVPLEARCCGTPVVMTDCTGHADHAHGKGVVIVETGELSDIDDVPGALAPSLSVEAIEMALDQAYRGWNDLKTLAMQEAAQLREEWTWEKKLESLIALL